VSEPLINTWDQLRAAARHNPAPAHWAISYRTAQERPYTGPVWVVWHFVPLLEHFREDKLFHVRQPVRQHKAATLAQAMAWLAKQHSYAPVWVRNRMGDYIDAQVNTQFPLQRQPKGEPHADGTTTHA
jgi:hypothetical protein